MLEKTDIHNRRMKQDFSHTINKRHTKNYVKDLNIIFETMRLLKYSTGTIHQITEIDKDSLKKILRSQRRNNNNKYPDVIFIKKLQGRTMKVFVTLHIEY